jgi:hypothetical protein
MKTIRNRLVPSGLLLISLFVAGCGSLLMSTKDRDPKTESLKVLKGQEAVLIVPTFEGDAKSAAEPAEAAKLATEVQDKLASELSKRGVKVSKLGAGAQVPAGATVVRTSITRYERGSGFARGFFPLFGLGNSYLDGTVVLVTASAKREIEVRKNGQMTGLSQMGDQTESNIDYFASAAADAVAAH